MNRDIKEVVNEPSSFRALSSELRKAEHCTEYAKNVQNNLILALRADSVK